MSERTSQGLGFEMVVLGAAGIAVSAGGVVWAGAAASAAISGGRLTAGLGEAIAALPRLPQEWLDPRQAWPAERRAELPGPVLYWLSTFAVNALAVAALLVVLRLWRASRERGRIRLGVDTRARFANVRDLAPLVVDRPAPSARFVLGQVHGKLVATEDRVAAPAARGRVAQRRGDRGSVAVIGPSRSGKTVNVIAGLLEWDGPAVVVSVKRDLIDATESARSARGEARVFDPTGVSGVPTRQLARWSPLRAASTSRGAQKAATALAASIPRSGVEGGGDYWVKQAEILLAGLLGAAALDPTRTMVDVAHWVFTKDIPAKGAPNEIIDILKRARDEGGAAEREAAGAAMLQLDAVWKMDERVRSSVYATVQTVVQAWLEPAVELSATLDDPHRERFVDLDWLTADGTANTLYLVAPLDDQRRLAPVLGGLLGDLKDQAYQRDVAGRTLRRPLLMVVDEAGNMPLAWLPEVAATCAGIGVLLVTIWQSKAQLDAAYGRLSDSVLTNHLTKIIFSGCSDPATLDYVSRLLGEEEVSRRSQSYDIAGGSRRRSISESVQREALTPFHLLRQVRPGDAVLIHGTLPPAHLRAQQWWTDPYLKALAAGQGARSSGVARRLAPGWAVIRDVPGPASQFMSTATKDTDRLAAAHQALSDAIANVITSEDWQQLLRISQSFHRYSPNNQLLLAAQGAEGLVASFNTWKQIPAVDGNVCRVRKGETAMRVYAPIRTTRREVDQETGDEIVERSVVRFKLVPVFHQGQLAAPPDMPVQPKLLVGDEPPAYLWDAVAAQIDAAGFRLERNALDGPGGANGVTSYLDKRVVVRDDLPPAQALKTEIHELAHVMLHAPDDRPEGMSRDLVEVEAESVAFVVCDMLGVDSASYSIPYVANWAGGEIDRVRSTAERVLGAARQIVVGLEKELGVELLQDPLAGARRQLADEVLEEHRFPAGAGRSTDELVADHLATGRLDWQQLATSIPAIERHRAGAVADDPMGQAVVLAEAGASAAATASVLRTHGLAEPEVARILTTPVPDMLGESPTLYPIDVVRAPLAEPTPIRPLAESLVADLIVAAGRHPAAARHLAESSGQPATVVSLVEERLRRSGDPVFRASSTTRSDRALALIDEWSCDRIVAGPAGPVSPEPPQPPAA